MNLHRTVTTPATSTWCYEPAPRAEGGSQGSAYAAFVRCRTAYGIGKQVKGRVVLGEAWNSFNVRTTL